MNQSVERLQAEILDAPSVEAREQIAGISLDNLRVTVKALGAFNVLLGIGTACLLIVVAAGWLPMPPDAGPGSTVWQVLAVVAAAALVATIGVVLGGAFAGGVTRDTRGHLRFFIASSVVPWLTRFAFFWVLAHVFALHISLVVLAASVFVTTERVLVQINEASLAKALESFDEAASSMLAAVTHYRRTMGITGDASSSGTGTVRLVWCVLWWTVSGLSLAVLASLAPLVGAGVVVLGMALEWKDFDRANDDHVFTRNLGLVSVIATAAVIIVLLLGL